MLKARNSITMTKIQDFLRLRNSALRLVTVFVTVIIFAHIIACLWFFISKIEGHSPDTWVMSSGHIDKSAGE
jgi:hypothetical protein